MDLIDRDNRTISTKNHRSIAMVFGTLLVLLLVGTGGYFMWQRHTAAKQTVPVGTTTPDTSQVQTAQTLALPASNPTKIKISAISVDANMVPLGLQKDGSVQVPQNGGDVGWYIYGPTPGEVGPSVVIGHLDTVKGKAVFYKLSQLKPGDEIDITRQDGKTAVFTVTGSESYSQNNFPSDKVYGKIDYAGLRLITCQGTYLKGQGHYSNNLVVYATLSSIR